MDYKHKVALVTGGARGIGKAYVSALLQRGVKVCIADLNETIAKQTVEELSKKHHGNVIFVRTDVSNYENFEKAVKQTISTFGRIDILINNAGIIDENNIEKMIAVNTMGTLYGIKLAFEYMGKDKGHNGGHVINTASRAGLEGHYELPAYTASKFAIVGATKAFGAEFHWRKHGVKINAICPGGVDTDLFRAYPDLNLDPVGIQKYLETATPVSPSAIADVMIRLLEDGKSGAMIRIYEDGIPHYVE